MEILGIVAVAALAYLLGSFPAAYVLAGNRVLTAGTGNIGAMNIFRTLKGSQGAFKAGFLGITVGIADAGKAALAVYISKWLLFFGYEMLFGLMAAVFFVVLGHCFSVYMKLLKGRFLGGRGLSSLFGAVAAINVPLAFICLGVLVFSILAAELVEKKKLSLRGLAHSLGHQIPGRLVGMVVCLPAIYYFSPFFLTALLPAIALSLLMHKERLNRYFLLGE